MKKYILFFFFLLAFHDNSVAQLCKRNVIDCPGLCGRFVDNNNDAICDLSPRSGSGTVTPDTATKKTEPVVAARPAEKETSADKRQTAAKTNQAVAQPVKKEPIVVNEDRETADTANAVEDDGFGAMSEDTTTTKNVQTVAEPEEHPKPYPLLEITALTLGLYFVTYLLVKFKVIKKNTHRKIWNFILLITFLMSGLLGFFLVVQLNYDVVMDWYLDFLKLHVEFGIAMAIISVFHAFWHLSYYVNMFKAKKAK